MLRLALTELNLAESTDGRSWRVGNLEPVTDTGFYFVLGKLVDRVEQRFVETMELPRFGGHPDKPDGVGVGRGGDPWQGNGGSSRWSSSSKRFGW